jgi:hypothetical protein
MISITKINAELGSAIIFDEDPKSQIRRHESRVSRTATLDGGAILDAQGYSLADRTLIIRASLTKEKSDDLWALYKSEIYINISCNDGYFFGAIERMEIDRGELSMTILIKE